MAFTGEGPKIKVPRGAPKIAIDEWIINETLEKALFKSIKITLTINDLFLVIPYSEDGVIDLETKYGKLKTFYVKELHEFQKYGRQTPQALLLSHKRFSYPSISRIAKPKSSLIWTP